MDRLTQFINDAIAELRHVRWPTRQQSIRLSVIVIGFTAVCALAFGGFDYILAKVLHFLLNLATF